MPAPEPQPERPRVSGPRLPPSWSLGPLTRGRSPLPVRLLRPQPGQVRTGLRREVVADHAGRRRMPRAAADHPDERQQNELAFRGERGILLAPFVLLPRPGVLEPHPVPDPGQLAAVRAQEPGP